MKGNLQNSFPRMTTLQACLLFPVSDGNSRSQGGGTAAGTRTHSPVLPTLPGTGGLPGLPRIHQEPSGSESHGCERSERNYRKNWFSNSSKGNKILSCKVVREKNRKKIAPLRFRIVDRHRRWGCELVQPLPRAGRRLLEEPKRSYHGPGTPPLGLYPPGMK